MFLNSNLFSANSEKQWEDLDSKIVHKIDSLLGKSTLEQKLVTFGDIVYQTSLDIFGAKQHQTKCPPQRSKRQLEMDTLRKLKRKLKKQIRALSSEETNGLLVIWRQLKARHSALSRAESAGKKRSQKRKSQERVIRNPFQFARQLFQQPKSGTLTLVHNKVISGFQALRQARARAPVAGLEPAMEGCLLISRVDAADDSQTGTKVAVKKLHRPFQSDIFAKRAYREIRMLSHFNHENLIDLLDIFTPNKSLADFKDVYLVTPLLDTDLQKALKCQTLQDDNIKWLIYQILRGLKDLKPNNIGVNQNSDLKILDFGLARSSAEEMTGYVVSRWYRAPEIILNWMHYNQKVDIWSVGCIFGEMITRKPLFKGADHINQLNKILHLVGTPSEDFIKKIASKDAQTYIRKLPKQKKQDYRTYFAGANEEAIDLLERMLDLDPDSRISVEDALCHPYIVQFHDPEDEPTAPKFDSSFESLVDANTSGWRKLVYEEVVNFKPKQRPQDCGE
ncbi:mitogen-activated protein kinase [Plakobranchus ocellatus]|uniref:mitogen-activated protein kinase n=1 Tax=Plakobranchus ocellatus TaxID=259542 RepID=A0AAV3Y5I4_9GAST|nr:mitogen-activated protein kinase [Plakobranchus ocellatus]